MEAIRVRQFAVNAETVGAKGKEITELFSVG